MGDQVDSGQNPLSLGGLRVNPSDRFAVLGVKGSRPTVRTPVSKTGYGGSNPSSPARDWRWKSAAAEKPAVK